MNRYGHLAMKHWKTAAPERFAQIRNPEDFFSTLGAEVESRIQELQDELVSPDQSSEGYLEKVGRLNAARTQAEEIALHELVWIEAETTEDETATGGAVSEFHRAIWEAGQSQDEQ